jgi:thioredoxin type arsenate reductase
MMPPPDRAHKKITCPLLVRWAAGEHAMGGLKNVRRPTSAAAARSRRRQPAILFLCVGNSARSQMAEGIARRLAPRGVRIYSAGSRPGGLNPLAVEAMEEIDIDISGHASKEIATIPGDEIDTVVFLCAEEVCPVFPARVQRIHWPLADPAAVRGRHQKQMAAFRRARTELHLRIGALMEMF